MDYAKALTSTAPQQKPSPAITQKNANNSPKPVQKNQNNSPKPQVKKQQNNGDDSSSTSSSVNALLNGENVSSPEVGRKGLPVLVRFEIVVPEIIKADEEDDDADDGAEEEENTAEEGGDAKEKGKEKEGVTAVEQTSSKDNVARKFSPGEIITKKNRQGELVAYLTKHLEEKNFEVKGGFRFLKKPPPQAQGKRQNPQKLDDLSLNTLPQAFRFVQAVKDLLSGTSPSSIAAGDNSFISISRAGDQVKVVREYRSTDKRSEYYFKLDDFVLGLRDQTKQWSKVIEAVDLFLSAGKGKTAADASAATQKKEKTLTPLLKKEVTTALKELRSLLQTSTAVPKLAEKFTKEQEKKKLNKQQMREETTRMREWALKAIPNVQHFLAMELTLPEQYIAPAPVKKQEDVEQSASPSQNNQQQSGAGNKKGNQQNNQQKGGNASGKLNTSTGADNASPATQKKDRKDDSSKKSGLQFSKNFYDIGDVNEPPTVEETSSPKPPKQNQNNQKSNNKQSGKSQQPQQQQSPPVEKKAVEPVKEEPVPDTKLNKSGETKQSPPSRRDKSPPVEQKKENKSPQVQKDKKPAVDASEKARKKEQLKHKEAEKQAGEKIKSSLKTKGKKNPSGGNELVTYVGGGVALILALAIVYLYFFQDKH